MHTYIYISLVWKTANGQADERASNSANVGYLIYSIAYLKDSAPPAKGAATGGETRTKAKQTTGTTGRTKVKPFFIAGSLAQQSSSSSKSEMSVAEVEKREEAALRNWGLLSQVIFRAVALRASGGAREGGEGKGGCTAVTACVPATTAFFPATTACVPATVKRSFPDIVSEIDIGTGGGGEGVKRKTRPLPDTDTDIVRKTPPRPDKDKDMDVEIDMDIEIESSSSPYGKPENSDDTPPLKK